MGTTQAMHLGVVNVSRLKDCQVEAMCALLNHYVEALQALPTHYLFMTPTARVAFTCVVACVTVHAKLEAPAIRQAA